MVARVLRRGVARSSDETVDVEAEVAPRLWQAVWADGSPWTLADARSVLSTTAVGVLICAWAWWEASGSADLDEQTGWVVVGLLGVIVVLKGMFSWLRAGRHQVRLRRLQIIRASEDAILTVVPDRVRTVDADAGDATAGGLVLVRGSSRYHRADCLLVTGKNARRPARPSQLRGRRPCEMCRPEATATAQMDRVEQELGRLAGKKQAST